MKKITLCYAKVVAVLSMVVVFMLGHISTHAQWSELGGTNISTFNDWIQSITIDARGNVYAAGSFANDSGKYYVAKWNGNGWQELGGANSSTFNSHVESLTTDAGGNVYAAGDFTNGRGKYYVAKWNGSSWQELGGNNSSAFHDYIFSITTDAVGNVYAAGRFTNGSSLQYVAKWNGNSWQELGGTNSSTFNDYIYIITTDAGANVYASGQFTNGKVKYYVAKYTNIPTPVTLSSFTAQTTKTNTLTTTWQTATELNTANFIIQHSTNGCSFSDIGTVKAIGSGKNGYSFIDNTPANGVNYYRLQIVDKDGSSSFSKVVCVAFGDKQSFSIIPNPAKDFATISFSKSIDKASIAVYDITGKAVITKSLNASTNSYKLNTQSLKSGLYVIKVNTAVGNYNEKLLINK